jgi:competence protein ComEC
VTSKEILRAAWVALVFAACGGDAPLARVPPPPQPVVLPTAVAPPDEAPCGGANMTVKFYDVGQGLGALVTLPDGKRILVDTGVLPKWPACGPCKSWSQRFLDELAKDVPDKALDTIWITHQHADHNGNADTVMFDYTVQRFVDNGSAGQTKGQKKRVKMLGDLAGDKGIQHWVTAPGKANSPWPDTRELTITPIVPAAWPKACDKSGGVNNCSIGLRIDYCRSSVLFTGDAEHEEEEVLPIEPVTLLQIAHHGSATSSTTPFLAKASPTYAVISSAKKNEGTNKKYCHPAADSVARVSDALPSQRSKSLWAFAGQSCKDQRPSDWKKAQVSEHLYATARDGHVTFQTNGDGRFDVK